MLKVRVVLLQPFCTVPKSRSLGAMVRQPCAIDAASCTRKLGLEGELMKNSTLPAMLVMPDCTAPCGHARTITLSFSPGCISLLAIGPAGSENSGALPDCTSRFESRQMSPGFWPLLVMVKARSLYC